MRAKRATFIVLFICFSPLQILSKYFFPGVISCQGKKMQIYRFARNLKLNSNYLKCWSCQIECPFNDPITIGTTAK